MEGSNTNIADLLQHGCELAKKFEVNDLPNLWLTLASTSGPLIITQKCDEIIECFSMAKVHLTSLHPSLLEHHHLLHHQHFYQPEMAVAYEHNQQGKGKGKEDTEVSMKAAETDRQEKEHRMSTEVGGSSSSAQQRNPRRASRNDDQGDNRRRVKMAAPQIGNTEMPPDDGFTWRKYGQKEILNAKYPRSYYRCTHQKLYNCPAKKQVQRLDDDPYTFDILYRGDHTCHMSNTAPSSVPPPPPSSQAVDDILIPHHHPTITTVHWLSMDFTKPSSEDARTIFDPQQHQQQLLYRANSSSSILGVNFPDTGTSTVGSHQGRDQTVDLLNNQSLLDWTEVFNSGSSGSNSMEIIFPSNDDNKWDNKDIKD